MNKKTARYWLKGKGDKAWPEGTAGYSMQNLAAEYVREHQKEFDDDMKKIAKARIEGVLHRFYKKPIVIKREEDAIKWGLGITKSVIDGLRKEKT